MPLVSPLPEDPTAGLGSVQPAGGGLVSNPTGTTGGSQSSVIVGGRINAVNTGGAKSTTSTGTATTTTTTAPALAPGATINPVTGQPYTYADVSSQYDATTKTTTTVVNGPTGAVQAWLLPTTGGQYQVYTDETKAYESQVQSLVSRYGSITNVKKFLWQTKQYGSTSTKTQASIAAGNAQDPTFQAAVQRLMSAASLENLANNGTDLNDVGAYINGRPNYAGTKNTVTIDKTNFVTAANLMSQVTEEYLNEPATADQIKQFQTALNTLEEENPTKATVTLDELGIEKNRNQTEGITTQDQQVLAISIITNQLMAKGVDPATSSDPIMKRGGELARNLSQVNTWATQYGVTDTFSPSLAIKSALNAMQPGNTIDNQKPTIINMAQNQYKTLSPLINDSVTTQDVTSQYTSLLNSVLERATPSTVNDPLVQKMLSGGDGGKPMSTDEATRFLQSQPEWQTTENAKGKAADLLVNLGQRMGFLA